MLTSLGSSIKIAPRVASKRSRPGTSAIRTCPRAATCALGKSVNTGITVSPSGLGASVAERTQELECAKAELARLSVTDPLAGLFNCRKLADSLQTEVNRASRQGLPLALLLVDIDHFKYIYDACGHPDRDPVLPRSLPSCSAASAP